MDIKKEVTSPILSALEDIIVAVEEKEGVEAVTVKNIEAARSDLSGVISALEALLKKETAPIVVNPAKNDVTLDLDPVLGALKQIKESIPTYTPPEIKDYSELLGEIVTLLSKPEEKVDLSKIETGLAMLAKTDDIASLAAWLEALYNKANPELPPFQFDKNGRLLISVDRVGGGGGGLTEVESIALQGVATSTKQDDIITAVDAVTTSVDAATAAIQSPLIVQASDSSSIDAFGRWRTSDTGQRFDVEFIYDTQDEIVDTVLVGAGTATHDTNSRDVTLAVVSTTNGDGASLLSYDVPYTAGNSQLIDVTGVLDYAAIGGGTAEIYFRTKVSGSVETTTYEQADWLANTSGINWSYSHIFQMDFQSLKVGRIRFNMVQNGLPVKVLEIHNDNIRNTGYWQLPSLPVRWAIYNTADETIMEMGYGDTENGFGFRYRIPKNASATMKAICATVKSEGGNDLFDMQGYSRAIDKGTTVKTVSNSLIPIISIRPRTTFHSLSNRSLIFPLDVTLTTDNPVRLALYHNNTLTGASWANVDLNESAMEYDVTASALTNGHLLWSEYVSAGKNTPIATHNALGRAVLWNRRGTSSGILTLAAIRTSGTDASVLAGLRWREIR